MIAWSQAAAEATSDTPGGPLPSLMVVAAVVFLAAAATCHWWGPWLVEVVRVEVEAWRFRRDHRRRVWVEREARRDVAAAAERDGA